MHDHLTIVPNPSPFLFVAAAASRTPLLFRHNGEQMPNRAAHLVDAVSTARSPPRAIATAAASAVIGEPAAAADLEEVHSKDYPENGIAVRVTRSADGQQTFVSITATPPRPDLVLHWGVDGWKQPPEASWPADTLSFGDGKAVQSPFANGGSGVHLVFETDDEAPGQV
jgi:hypothetical protein